MIFCSDYIYGTVTWMSNPALFILACVASVSIWRAVFDSLLLRRLYLFLRPAGFKRRTLHVPNLIRGEKKYHPYCSKEGNLLKKVKVTKPGYSCFDFSVICVLLWQGDS